MRLLPLLLLLLLAACSQPAPEVVVYTSVDRHYAEPVLQRFQRESGITVRAVYDVEAAKTTGLVNRLLAERARPQADLFWNGEIAQTLRLKAAGALAPYTPPAGAPVLWRDPEGHWTAFGGRARVLLVNHEALGERPPPRSIFDLADPAWPAERMGIALPLFGTTATHAAALWAQLGPDQAEAWFATLQERGVAVLDGNARVRDQVAAGALWAGLTDSDDACGAAARGAPVTILFPDQEPGGLGTPVIPNSLALVAGGPHPEAARQLADFLLAPATLEELARRGWFHVVGDQVARDTGCPLPETIRILDLAPERIAATLPAAQAALRERFLR